MWTAVDYMYRDAGNFKAFGSLILRGRLGAADQELIRARLSSREFFIAEQVGMPALYDELYRWSEGPTNSDHCWHELIGFRDIPAPEGGAHIIDSEDLVSRFAAVHDWDEALSPHFDLASSSELLTGRGHRTRGRSRNRLGVASRRVSGSGQSI